MSLATLRRDARFTLGVLRSRPFQLLAQITNRCNMQCSFCDFWPNPAAKGEELTSEEFRRVGRELGELGCFIVSIEGGEPLIRKDLTEIVAAFAERHIPLLYTNGWYVDQAKAKALFDAGLVQVGVSIDYAAAGRHDEKRRLTGATDRAWRAVETLRDAAPHGGRQVHVMTVVTDDNWQELEELVQQSQARGVGHQFTLLSVHGFRRGSSAADRLPPPEVSDALVALHRDYQHIRFFRDYFTTMGSFLKNEPMPVCRAGVASFNLDHVGNVSPCIEKIDSVVGNVRQASLSELYARLSGAAAKLAGCQDCFTACRGLTQSLGPGTVRGFFDLATRMRSQ